MGGGKQGVVDGSESDSIQNSDIPLSETSGGVTNGMIGIDLDVVLPNAQQVMSAQVAATPVPRANRSTSGTAMLLQSDGDGGLPDREMVEAEKLITLAEEVGLKFHGCEGEYVARVLAMEERDCEEKEGWEMRRKNTGSLVFSFTGDDFVGVCLDLVDKQIRVCVINVYAKCNIVDKRKLWNDLLMTKRGFSDIVWCLVGDFNSVVDTSERRGVDSVVVNNPSREMREFTQFLEDLGLIDLPLIGRTFTWFHPNGLSMSRLDRVLVSNEWITLWGNPKVWVAPRDVSDHCPVILRYDVADWGLKPFRFNNFWLHNKSFRDFPLALLLLSLLSTSPRTTKSETFSHYKG
ncbi:cysteine-rich receptor-like protein kinase [Trifolium pratense]|uniref:Cysteine-rich receptor-like protein kinase n=1 Tax=Trifolium pratense TaxID=57577 RepID=A0A2K3N936_TRIPR|nr:cysteine-rich receptor-like protein kinase [Trifolium pratense]